MKRLTFLNLQKSLLSLAVPNAIDKLKVIKKAVRVALRLRRGESVRRRVQRRALRNPKRVDGLLGYSVDGGYLIKQRQLRQSNVRSSGESMASSIYLVELFSRLVNFPASLI
jgi:hypothetical protein